jgi:predicted transcriptional regulator
MAITLRLTDEQNEALEELARTWGTSKQIAAVKAIEESRSRLRGTHEVKELGLRSLERWAPVYDALART